MSVLSLYVSIPVLEIGSTVPFLWMKHKLESRLPGEISITSDMQMMGFPGSTDSKASASSAGDPGSIPGLGRSPGEGNGNPLQYSCLENSINGGAW